MWKEQGFLRKMQLPDVERRNILENLYIPAKITLIWPLCVSLLCEQTTLVFYKSKNAGCSVERKTIHVLKVIVFLC